MQTFSVKPIKINKIELINLKYRLLTKIEYFKYRHYMPIDYDYWWWIEEESETAYTKAFVDEEGYIDNLISDNTKLGLRVAIEFDSNPFLFKSNTKEFILDGIVYTRLYTENNRTVAISNKVLYDKLTYEVATYIINHMNTCDTAILSEDIMNIYNLTIAKEKEIDDTPIALPKGAISNLYEIMLNHDKQLVL